jgi:putative transposase
MALRRLHDDGRSLVDESAIFRTVEAMRTIADEAVRVTKSVRRQRERRLRVVAGGAGKAGIVPDRAGPVAPIEGVAPLEDRILPFEEWS